MRKITLLIASLFIAIGAMAQNFDPNANYRIKVSDGTGSGEYVTIGDNKHHAFGYVHTMSKVEDNKDQIFSFIDSDSNGKWKVKSDNDEYFYAHNDGIEGSGWNGWNLNKTEEESLASEIIFTSTGNSNEYYLQVSGTDKYLKVDPVQAGNSNYKHVYYDASQESRAKFIVEKVSVERFTVVYKYKHDDKVIMTKTYEVLEGEEYPDLISGLYRVTVNDPKPSGSVSKNGEFEFSVTIGEMPFEYYESYEAVEKANGWYNLVMHSNQGSGYGYRTYLGADNGETLAWGEHYSLTNAGDQYYWAFVGDPINGFRVVNKLKGDGYILSSDGTNNPLLREVSNLGEGYNTTWQIAARTDNNGGDWVAEGDWFCLKYRDNWYMNANAQSGKVNFWNVDDNGSGILAVKPITINAAADYATYFAETSFTIPGTLGAEVYYVNNVENGYAKFEQITGVVYSETGVVVKFDTDENVTYAPEFVSPGTATEISDNLLKGTTKKTLFVKENNKAYYALGLVEGVVGFYNAVNGDNENEFYNGAFKAYLELPTSQSTAAFYGFNFDETTGVEEVEVESTVKTIYDLSGRKVSGMSAPGLYIVNGKKVLVK